ncbi:hypothetical protein Pint_23189 [Pistacia integerrima]|uniref:Uncharacterized protein n=1 Tax=Pistacia integerrima TaxID=434235 RepID=A0ACC0YJD8_9ROSI|nr:hypothetical protein Pint_23189 [Pistacia integerrima]
MIPSTTSANLTSLSSSSTQNLAGNFLSRRFFFLHDIQILELFLALFVFVSIHSLRQKKRYGLPVWPFLGMLPSLVSGLQGNMYEWLTDVICSQNAPTMRRGNDKGRRQALSSTQRSSGNSPTESLLELVHSGLLPVLENSVNSLVSIDLQDILLRLTFDNVCMIAFGVDPGFLRPGLPEIPFAKAFEDATEATVFRFVTPTCIWKIMRYLDLGTERKLKQSIKGVDEFAEEVIRRRKKELSLLSDKNTQRSDILSIFMGLKNEHGQPYSDKFLRDICVNFILAGRDTSSVALSWFFWLLEQNPRVEEKILAEICRIVGEREEVKRKESPLVFKPEEIKKMDYLHAALSEALRLYPSVPVDHKEVVEDDIFPDGTVVKRGTKVIYAIYAMGRMEAIWGKDCREFKPERWLRDGRFMSESAYKFTAFNGGPRLCLGKDFAYYQMKFAAASIIYRYSVKVAKNHPVVPKLALTMYMKHGLKVNLYKRQELELQKYYSNNNP